MDKAPKERNFLNTLRAVKHIEWITVLLVAGAIILVFATWQTPADDALAASATTPAPPSDLESRMESTLSLIEGAGRVRVLLYRQEGMPQDQEPLPAIVGVVVVADGAQDLSVRVELSRAVQSLLDVPQKNIEIFAMAKESEE